MSPICHSVFKYLFCSLFLVSVWYGAIWGFRLDINLFPTPHAVGMAFIDSMKSGEYISDLYASLYRALMGLITGIAVAIVIGISTGYIRTFDYFLMPLVNFFRSIPPIAIVPIAILWMGIGEDSKIFLVFWGVFFPVWVNTYQGVLSIKEDKIWSLKIIGASQAQILWHVILPGALPYIVAGIRIGIALAFINLIAAEMSGSFEGLGFRITASHMVFRTDKMFMAIISLGILGFIFDRAFINYVKYKMPWIKLHD